MDRVIEFKVMLVGQILAVLLSAALFLTKMDDPVFGPILTKTWPIFLMVIVFGGAMTAISYWKVKDEWKAMRQIDKVIRFSGNRKVTSITTRKEAGQTIQTAQYEEGGSREFTFK